MLHKKYSIKYLTSILISLIIVIQINPFLYTIAQNPEESNTIISSTGTLILPSTNVILLNDGFEGVTWNAHWTNSNWYRSTYEHTGEYCAAAIIDRAEVLTSESLDASDAYEITVDFWYMKMNTEASDLSVYYYDGNSYILIDELGDYGEDYPSWVHFTHTTINTRYFNSNFQIRFDANLGSGEQTWVDDILITKRVYSSSNLNDLTVNIVGNGFCNVNPSGPYTSGSVATLTAVPAPGWVFAGWGGHLVAQGTTNPASLIMNEDKWVQATFTEASIVEYSLSTSIVGEGVINVSPSGPYEDGSVATLTAVPSTGWTFTGWSGSLSGSTNPASLTMNGDKWVQATFSQTQPIPGVDLKILRFESSHTLGINVDNGDYIASIIDSYFCWPYHSAVLSDMHSAGGEVYSYRNFQAIASTTSEFQTAVNNNWALVDSNGQYVYERGWIENKLMDAGSQTYRQYLANYVQSQINAGFDGIFVDNGMMVNVQTQWIYNTRPLNPRTGQLYTDEEWFNDHLGLLTYVKNQVPQAKIICNGMLYNGYEYDKDRLTYQSFLAQSNMNTLFIEGIFNNLGTLYSETDWKRSVDLVIWLQNNFLNNPQKSLILWSQAKSGIPDFVTRDQMALFIYTSSLMGVSKTNQNYISCHGHMESSFTQSLYNINLGLPEEKYHIISGTKIYEREYTKAKILVNPVSSSYTIDLESPYIDMEGHTITSITIPGYSGVILKK